MMKLITNYKPMNLSTWDKSGQGRNVVNLFTPLELEIWDKAFPYQDKRDDVGHAEHVLYFAFKLLEYIQAERAIVIPAAILHDTGWGDLIPKVLHRYEPFSEDFRKNEQRYRDLHQKAGVEISKKILEEVNYPQIHRPTILEIISQHDTRAGFLSLEDGVVRDADKLWRFTLRQTQMDYYAKKTLEQFRDERLQELEKTRFFYSDISKHIARVELEQTIRYLRLV